MKKIAIISLVLVPLTAGCSNSTLGPRLAPEAKQAPEVSSLQAQMRKLQRRVRALNRRVKAQPKRSSYAPASGSGDLREIKARLAQLEATPRGDRTTESTPDLEREVAGLAAQLAQLSRKVEAQGNQQPQPSAAVTQELAELKVRLAELEAAPRPAEPRTSDSDLKRTVANLAARLQSLSRSVEAQANREPQAPKTVTRDLGTLKGRLAELEAAQRSVASSTSNSDLKRMVANLTGRLDTLSRNVDAQANRLPQAPQSVTRDVGELKARLAEIEKTRRSAASDSSVSDLKRSVTDLAAQFAKLSAKVSERSNTPPPRDDAAMRKLTESLTKLEKAQTTSANELGKLQNDLEKDRTLVIDYLEDLDNRLAEMEKAAPAGTPPATSPSKP